MRSTMQSRVGGPDWHLAGDEPTKNLTESFALELRLDGFADWLVENDSSSKA